MEVSVDKGDGKVWWSPKVPIGEEIQSDNEEETSPFKWWSERVIEESVKTKAPKRIIGPSDSERREHEANQHIPSRSWCDICVRATMNNPPHFKKKGEGRGIPVFSIDYMYLNQKGDADRNPILVVKDSENGGIWSIMVIRKGNYNSYASTRVARIVDSVGYPKCIIKCDQEPSIKNVTEEVRRKLWEDLKETAHGVHEHRVGGLVQVEDEDSKVGKTVIHENSPVGESSSNGAVERAIQEVQGQIRKLKINIEKKTGEMIEPNHPIWPWLIEFAGMSLYMYKVNGKDGLTSRCRTKGRASMTAKAGFGEQVLYKPSKTVKIDKTEERWKDGTWLGVIDGSDEHIIGTDEGVVKCRAIHPKEDKDKWDMSALNKIVGTPWKPNPNRNSLRIPTRIAGRHETDDTDDEGNDIEDFGDVFKIRPEIGEDADARREALRVEKQKELAEKSILKNGEPRKLYITMADVHKYKATPGCNGCRHAEGKISWTASHNDKCRARMIENMKGDIEDSVRVENYEVRVKSRGTVPRPVQVGGASSSAVGNQPSGAGDVQQPQRRKRQRDPEAQDDIPDPRVNVQIGGKRSHEDEDPNASDKRQRSLNSMDTEMKKQIEATMHKIEGDQDRNILDITTHTPEGEIWNFDRIDHRNRVLKKVIEERPDLVIGSVVHTKFNNQTKWKTDVEQADRNQVAMRHMTFIAHIYQLQQREGRFYIHERHHNDHRGAEAILEKIIGDKVESRWHACPFEVRDQGRHIGSMIGSISIWTNSIYTAANLNHTSKQYINMAIGRSTNEKSTVRSRLYPRSISDSISAGIAEEYRIRTKPEFLIGILEMTDDSMKNKEKVEHAHNVAEKCHNEAEGEMEAFDDTSGVQLDPDLVRKARQAEIEYFTKMGVYRKVPREKCYEQTGKAPIGVRWVDVNKQDNINPKYRSRLVAKHFKTGASNPEWYAATPPLEALRTIISIAATTRTSKRLRKIMVNDVARAYFYAPCTEPMFVELCEEDRQEGDEGMCGELAVSMYGTRPAATNWQKCYTELLLSNGFQRAISNTCLFYHPTRGIHTLVHGDDFVSTADGDELLWLDNTLKGKFEISTDIIGPENDDKKQLKVLNRIITYEDYGITYEPDPRHAELVIKQLGLEKANAVTSPSTKDDEYVKNPEGELDYEGAHTYKSIVARCNYLSLDRSDIQYAVKECARGMSKPTNRDYMRLKRIGRYLKHRPRAVIEYHWQAETRELKIYTDANWAGDKRTRKSTSGGAIFIGDHLIKSWSKTQSVIALSSAESELYGSIKAAAEGLGQISLLRDWGMDFYGKVLADASAALGIISRQGLGKVRHIDTSYLWIQQVSAERQLEFSKVPGESNIADLMTKDLDSSTISKHCASMGLEFKEGRSALAAELNT